MRSLVLLLSCTMLMAALGIAGEPDPLIERGKYLSIIAGCGDCHTPGYAEDGVFDESIWLIGDQLGFKGPWGTTYPINLRLRLAQMSEQAWVEYAKSMRSRPPMPWFNVVAMTEEDLRAIYRYVRHLGPAGGKAPQYLPPGTEPAGPVLLFPSPPEQADGEQDKPT